MGFDELKVTERTRQPPVMKRDLLTQEQAVKCAVHPFDMRTCWTAVYVEGCPLKKSQNKAIHHVRFSSFLTCGSQDCVSLMFRG